MLEEADRCEVLHIATHGYADPDFPEFSGLLLAGEGDKKYDVLTAQDVRFWSLRARLAAAISAAWELHRGQQNF